MQQTGHYVGYLWRASFAINLAFGLKRQAEEIFQEKIARHLWAVHQTGRIDRIEINHPAILLVIDTREDKAQEAFNQLPALLTPSFNFGWKRDWKLPVYEYKTPPYKPYYRDNLTYRNGIFYLEGYALVWEGYEEERDNLDRGIMKEMMNQNNRAD